MQAGRFCRVGEKRYQVVLETSVPMHPSDAPSQQTAPMRSQDRQNQPELPIAPRNTQAEAPTMANSINLTAVCIESGGPGQFSIRP
jgi:hypothetical protein